MGNTQTSSDAGGEALARWSLRANAAFSAASGLVFIVFSNPVSAQFSVHSNLVAVVAAGLLLFAAVLLAAASAKRVSQRALKAFIVADLSWVVASVPLVVLSPAGVSGTGHALVIAIAIAVLGFAVAQAAGLRRLRVASVSPTAT